MSAVPVSSAADCLEPANLRQRIWNRLEIPLVVMVFWMMAGSAPPSVNEAHYLAKARHSWDPYYCPDDFFLQSADAHLVFFWTAGLPTRWLPLPWVAVFGRLAAWLLLAAGICRLTSVVVGRKGWGVLVASLFAGMLPWTQMSGEWVVGGVEAKPFSYGLVFLGLASLAAGDWRVCWLWLGGASAVHVLVGGWSTLAVAGCWLVSSDRLAMQRMWPWLLGGGLLSLPGIIPALLLASGVEADVVGEAHLIYVFRRLSHHLVFSRFAIGEVIRHLLAVGLLGGLVVIVKPWRAPSLRRLVLVTVFALTFSLAGALIDAVGLPAEREAAWLRYYWFRLGDALVPLLLGLMLVVGVKRWWSRHEQSGKTALCLLGMFSGLVIGSGLLDRLKDSRPMADRQSLAGGERELQEWHAVCRWIREFTPSGAVFLTPYQQQTFKWNAQRAEVVTWKDVPQGPADLVEWWRRMQDCRAVSRALRGPPDMAEVRRVCQKYGASYILVRETPKTSPLPIRSVYPPDGVESLFRVYRLEDE